MYHVNRLSLYDLQKFLNGTLESEPFPNREGLPLGGLTLILSAPSAATVTFTGAAGAYLTADQIVAEINSTFTGLAKKVTAGNGMPPKMYQDGRAADPMVRIELTDDGGVTIDPLSTALPVLVFPDLSGTLTDAADIIAFSPDAMPGYHWLITKDH